MNTYRDPENACVKLEITTATSNYPIYIGPNLLSQVDFYLSRVFADRIGDLLLVSNETVYPLYGGLVEENLAQSGKRVHRFIMPDGEQFKTWDMAEKILSFALKQRLSRQTVVAALGGGVVGDLAGFAAAVYLRSALGAASHHFAGTGYKDGGRSRKSPAGQEHDWCLTIPSSSFRSSGLGDPVGNGCQPGRGA